MQVHFVSVCRGVARPVTAPERAYLAWRVKEDARRKRAAEDQATKRQLARERERGPSRPPGVTGRWSDPKSYEDIGIHPAESLDRAAASLAQDAAGIGG
jgi:hypothetical protein